MQAIVDRIEGNIVVLELEDKIINVEKDKVEGDVLEGDVVDVEFENEEIVKIKKNEDKTKSRQDYMDNLIKGMWQ